jgi:hypothetical protein
VFLPGEAKIKDQKAADGRREDKRGVVLDMESRRPSHQAIPGKGDKRDRSCKAVHAVHHVDGIHDPDHRENGQRDGKNRKSDRMPAEQVADRTEFDAGAKDHHAGSNNLDRELEARPDLGNVVPQADRDDEGKREQQVARAKQESREGAHCEQCEKDRDTAHERDRSCMSFTAAGMVDNAQSGRYLCERPNCGCRDGEGRNKL